MDTPDYFFFLPLLADGDRAQPFTLTASATFPSTGHSLFVAPGFTAARALMGGSGISNLRSGDARGALSVLEQGQMQVTPNQVIAAMAQAIVASTGSGDADTLSKVGEYAFSSLTCNPILRGVESTFAAMAEDRMNDSTRGNINDCVDQALTGLWKKMSSQPNLKTFQKAFQTAFNNSYRLLYNLDIPLAQVLRMAARRMGDFSFTRGSPQAPTLLGNRMATPQDFQKLVLAAISATGSQLSGTKGAQDISDALTEFVQTDAFLKQALWAYDPANKQEADPVGNYQKLSRTPMQSCDGDNPFEVDDIDTGTSYDGNVQTYTPSNAKDLITWSLNLAKTAPVELIPMDSPQHAFNFVPGNPDLVAFVERERECRPVGEASNPMPGTQVSRKQSARLRNRRSGIRCMSTSLRLCLTAVLINSSSIASLRNI